METEQLKIKEGFLGQRMLVLPPDIRNKILSNEITKNLHLTAIGHYPNAVYHDRERKKGCDEYILLYCLEGQGNIDIYDKSIVLSANEFFIIPPNIPHHYKSSTTNPWSIYWAHFSGETADHLYSRYTKQTDLKPIKIPFNEHKSDQFLKIIQLLENSYDDAHLELSNLYLFQFITTLIYQPLITNITETNDPVSKSINFMKENVDQSLTIAELAEQQSLSISRYSEIFKQQTGSSPINYFIHLKMQKSCQFLYFTNMSIKEIAASVGFSDPYYFSRMFKKVLGISPSKYKSDYKK